jgi:hypothetical protein
MKRITILTLLLLILTPLAAAQGNIVTFTDMTGGNLSFLAAGATPYSFISTASANLINVKASKAILYSITLINPGTTLQSVRLYNKASAPDPSACSANSDCAVIYSPIPVMADSSGSGFTISFGTSGIAFSAGLGFSISGAACTVVSTCTDETNAAAGVTIILTYK